MRQSMFTSPAQREQFTNDVLHFLRAHYMLDDGTVIEGQSLSHLQSCLRDGHMGSGVKKWRLGGGYYGVTSALEECGFKLVRARSMRSRWDKVAKCEKLVPYAHCDVVTV